MKTIELKGLTKPLSIAQVLYFSADGPYAQLHTTGGQIVQIWLCLALINRKYPDFLRIHRGYLVNPHHVLCIQKRHMQLSTNSLLPVARRRLTAIQKFSF